MKQIRKLFIISALIPVLMINSAFTPFNSGKIIMVITLEVKDYTKWKTNFDSGASVREQAGIKVLSVCRSMTNENQIMVIEEAENAQASHDFLTVLKSRQKAGDISAFDIKLYDKAF